MFVPLLNFAVSKHLVLSLALLMCFLCTSGHSNTGRRGRRQFVCDTPASSTWSIATSASSASSASSSATSRELELQRDDIISNLMLSPNNKPSPAGYEGGSMSVPKTATSRRQHGRRAAAAAPPQDREHVWSRGLNTKATSCAVCLGSVLFVKEAAKCQGQSGVISRKQHFIHIST